jgi:hypothetical protein
MGGRPVSAPIFSKMWTKLPVRGEHWRREGGSAIEARGSERRLDREQSKKEKERTARLPDVVSGEGVLERDSGEAGEGNTTGRSLRSQEQ